jgi:hypothetical protein
LADYDGDGLADLISGSPCCQRPPRFHVFLRKKDGKFASRRQVTLDYPKDRYEVVMELPLMGLQSRVAVADWNGDGIPDVLIGGDTKVLGVAYGPLAGKDVLTIERVWPKGKEPLRPMTTNPCVADWDGDGLPDLIVGGCTERRDYPPEDAAKTRGIYWLRNRGPKGSPKFAEPKLLIADDDRWSFITGICVADWNGDGRPDLIVSHHECYRVGEGSFSTRKHHVWVYLRQAR